MRDKLCIKDVQNLYKDGSKKKSEVRLVTSDNLRLSRFK